MGSLWFIFFFLVFSLLQLSLVSNKGHNFCPICFLTVHLLSILQWRKSLDLDKLMRKLKEDKYVKVHQKAYAKNAPGDSSYYANLDLMKNIAKLKAFGETKGFTVSKIFTLSYHFFWWWRMLEAPAMRQKRECVHDSNVQQNWHSRNSAYSEEDQSMKKEEFLNTKRTSNCEIEPQFSSEDPQNQWETPIIMRAKDFWGKFNISKSEMKTSIFTEAGPSSWMYFSKHRFTIDPAKLWKYPENDH